MVKLVATDTSVTINNNTFPKNTLMVLGRENPESIKVVHANKITVVMDWTAINEFEVNGLESPTYGEVLSWMSNNFFVNASSGEGAIPVETAESIKDKYGSNPDINHFTDAYKEDVDTLLLHPPLTNNPHQVNADQVGLGNVDNTSDADKPVSTATSNALDEKQSLSEKGQAGGYPELGDDGLIPISYLNVSGLNYKGTWDASSNTPELNNGEGNVGDFYKVSFAGSYDFGNGVYEFGVGDWVIFAAGVWQRLGSSEIVSSVNGKIGAVVVNKSDVGLSEVNNTDDANKPLSLASIAALQGKANFPSVNSSIPIRGSGGNQSSLAYTSEKVIGTIPRRDSVGNFSVEEPTIPSHTATKAYVDANSGGNALIDTTVANGVTTKEYSNRYEHTYKASIGAFNYGSYARNTYNLGAIFPISVSEADEHYFSTSSNSRVVNEVAYLLDNGVRIGTYNTLGANANNVRINIFIKLIKFK